MAQNERTLKMKQGYVELHNSGLSPVEIAKKFNLSTRTVYNCLGEIAAETGVSRASLLSIPHKDHIGYERKFEPVPEVDLTSFRQHFDAALAEMTKAKEAVEEYLNQQEQLAIDFEKEEEAWRQQ